jgi:hypothetical protein
MPTSKLVALVLAAAALLIAACVGCGEPPPLDTSLLTGEPCEPPCWQGLTPGESTEEDVAEFMRTTRFVDTRTVYRGRITRAGEVVGVSIQWRSTFGGGRGYNSFDIHAGVLSHITIHPDYDLTLERLIGRHGPPEKYNANLSGYERQWIDVTLYYPTHGFTVYLVLYPNDATLRPDSSVESVWYFRAAQLGRFLELGWEAGRFGSVPAPGEEFGRDWQGYGPIPLD